MTKKILFVLESFFPSHRAGTEVYVYNLCKYLKSNKWDVNVLISSTSESNDYIFDNIPVYTFSVTNKLIKRELNGLKPPTGIEHFLLRVNEIQPEIIHFHSFGRAINSYHLQAVKQMGIFTAFTPHLGGLFCIKGDLRLFNKINCNGKVIERRCFQCILHHNGYSAFASKILGFSANLLTFIPFSKHFIPAPFFQVNHRKNELKRIKKYADLVFSISPWIQKAFEVNGINNSVLIPQGISPLFFDSKPRQIFETKVVFNFAFIGRMHSSKGFHLLQHAWNNLKSTNCRLHVLTSRTGGETDYFDSIKQWAFSKSNVIWNENLSQVEVASYLSSIDILILPSISNEVAPLVIQEAASFLIPTIASDYIAMKDMIIHGENGLLFKNGNWFDLLEQIEKITTDPTMLNALRANVKDPISMNLVAAQIEKEYYSIK